MLFTRAACTTTEIKPVWKQKGKNQYLWKSTARAIRFSCVFCIIERYKKTIDYQDKDQNANIKLWRVSCCCSLRNLERSKKKMEGVGGREERKLPSLPSPFPFIPFFALVPVFSTNSRGTACYAGYCCCCFCSFFNLNIRDWVRSHNKSYIYTYETLMPTVWTESGIKSSFY